jgi:hypothetical protein
MPWYVTVEEAGVSTRYPANPEDKIWTVSQVPDATGWNNDVNQNGYGMPKAAAQFLADAANEKEARDGVTFPIMTGEW